MLRKSTAAIAAMSILCAAVFSAPPAAAEASDAAERYDFVIADSGGAADIYIDADGADYDGLSLVAEAFANDVNLVSGRTPEIVTDASKLGGTAIIAGTVGDAGIRAMSDAGKIDVSDVAGRNEVYKIKLVDAPIDGVDKALVIAGSDKRGTVYGIFHISELMGVSPWVYWGDVLPERRSEVGFGAAELETTSKEPSVRFRGIFLNDEYPNLTKWTGNTFKGYNHNFYQTVFELLLRLKGNYMWPAMWSNSFSEDGVLGLSADEAEGFDTLENARLADKYGVIMGTSHHEPLCRAGVEWGRTYRDYMKTYYPEADISGGSSSVWNYFKYPKAIGKFWEDGYARNKDFENVTTIGMRGEADSSLEGGLATNIENLKNVIKDQKEIIKKAGKETEPTMLALYKEVEEYWYGGYENGEYVPGLRESNLVDDTIVMLCDDNFGNLRSVPMADEIDRGGGWGMYYHFDYHGAPIDYRWVSSTPLEKIWENMTAAYEYKIDDLWIVNVGDLKPHELEISYFLDLAYDYDRWKDVNKVEEYTLEWTRAQFGCGGVGGETLERIAKLQLDYLRMNGDRRPEIVYTDTYSITDSNELYKLIERAEDIYEEAYELYELVPDRLKDAYYQLVLYPAAGSANVNLMNAYSALNAMYSSAGSLLANKYAVLVNECVRRDTDMQTYYNTGMSGGKWKDMMSTELAHIGCTSWDLTNWAYPGAVYVTPAEGERLIVFADGSKKGVGTGELSLPTFTCGNREAYAIAVTNGGRSKLKYTASASADWIRLSKTEGEIYSGDVIEVAVDWQKLAASAEGTVRIAGGGSEVTVRVSAEVIDETGLPDGTFIGRDGIISIDAKHYAAVSGDWITIDGLGKSGSSIKTRPFTAEYDVNSAPCAEYRIKTEKAGEYTVTAITGANNPRTTKGDLRYAVSVDGAAPAETSALKAGFAAGDYSTGWGEGVLKNSHMSSQTFYMGEGLHTLRFYPLSSGVVLQKLVVSETADIGDAYLGPEESRRAGEEPEQRTLSHHTVSDTMNIPGIVSDNGSVIVSGDGAYTIRTDADFALKIDGADAAVSKNADGSRETELTAGEHTLEFSGAAALEFERIAVEPGIVINHPMSTEAEFASAAAGYTNLTDGHDDARTVTFSDGAMNYTTTGLYVSSGFKYDITSAVRRAREEYGEDIEFTLSMDIKSRIGGNGTPSIGFRNASGIIASTEIADKVNENGYSTVTCSSKLSADAPLYFYLYAAEPTSYVRNIRVTYPAPRKKELFAHTSAADWAAYTVYDESNTDAVKTDGDAIAVDFNGANESKPNNWNVKNGIKVDITSYVKDESVTELGASADILSYWWGDSKVKLFVEIERDGKTEAVTLAEQAGTDNGTAVTVSGGSAVSLDGADRVYLCVTHPSGYHTYDNITLWCYSGETAADPAPTDDPTPTDAPERDTRIVIFSDDFSAAETDERYSAYTDGTLKTVDEDGNPVINGARWGRLGYNFIEGYSENNGMKADITDAVFENGLTTLNASADVLSYWWNDTPAKLTVEVRGGDGAVKQRYQLGSAPEDFTDMNGRYASVSGSADIDYADGDRIYLCVTHPSGTHQYDNIMLWTDSADTAGGRLIAGEPILGENGAYILVTNKTEESAMVRICAVSYNDDGTLGAADLTETEIEAGAENVRIDFDAARGETVYVWDGAMRPLVNKTVLQEKTRIAGWASAQQEYLASDLPATELSGSVIRQRIRMSAGGDCLTLTLSNEYGDSPLVISSVHLAAPAGSGVIDPAADTAVTFGGSEGVTVPAGERVESDVILYPVKPLDRVMMTIAAAEVPEKVTGHSGARTTTYIKSGGTVSDVSMIGAETDEHWYFASEIDVMSAENYGVIACLGDSTTDGRGVDTNADNRWTDVLAERVVEAGLPFAVVNDGIGGNAINNWGLGESGLDRYRKQIVNRAGVKYLIVLEGINDIGGRTEDVFSGDMSKCPEDGTITSGVKNAYRAIIDDAHERGIKVIGGTIMPCGNNDYFNETSEAMRQDLNEWIRTEGGFDAVIDFDAAVRDENDPTKLKAEYDSGDGLHPSPAGYRAMGECVDLGLFD